MKIKEFIFKNNYTKEEIQNILNSFNKKEKPWFEKYIMPSILDPKQSLPLQKIQEIKNLCTQESNTYRNYPFFKNLYHILYHPQMLLRAYSNMIKNKGGLTSGIDKKTLDGFSMKNIYNLHNELKTQTYKPQPVRRVWIPKPGKPFPEIKRPLAVPTIKDRITQESLRIILNTIYEPLFQIKNHNYGFRPNKSTLDSISYIQSTAKGSQYAIEGDIKGAFDNINHTILLNIIQQQIQDKKVLKLISLMLKSGIMDKGKIENSITGVTQGSILSPLLFNIYMFEFDKYIENQIIPLTEMINKAQNRKKYGKRTKEYLQISNKILNNSKKIKKISHETNKTLYQALKIENKKLSKTRIKIPYTYKNTINTKIIYTRYADDWVIFIHGDRHFTQLIYNKIQTWLKQYLKLTLSPEKTLITKCNEKWVKFLGFALRVQKNPIRQKYVIRNNTRFLIRTGTGFVTTTVDTDRLIFKLRTKGFVHKEIPNSIGKKAWTHLDLQRIIKSFRTIIIGLFNYYKETITFKRDLNWTHHLLKTSCAKTLCLKYKKKSMSVIFRKYGPYLNVNNLKIPSKKELYERKIINKTNIDKKDPLVILYNWRSRLKIQSFCSICSSTENIEMHHIRRLRGPTGKDVTKGFEKIMGAINRKQIPVCKKCHTKIHQGIYDSKSLNDIFTETINQQLIEL